MRRSTRDGVARWRPPMDCVAREEWETCDLRASTMGASKQQRLRRLHMLYRADWLVQLGDTRGNASLPVHVPRGEALRQPCASTDEARPVTPSNEPASPGQKSLGDFSGSDGAG